MNYEELVKLAKEYDRIGKEIVENLPDTDECRCNEKEYDYIDVIYYGNLCNEIHRYCLRCGGMREVSEGI